MYNSLFKKLKPRGVLATLFFIYFTINSFYSNAQTQQVLSWAKKFGGSSYDAAKSIYVDAVGNVYVTGYIYGEVDLDPGFGEALASGTTGDNVFISKFDALGNFVWGRMIDCSNTVRSNSIVVDKQGYVYVAGTFATGSGDFDPGSGTRILNNPVLSDDDAYILKLNNNGNFVSVLQIPINTSGVSTGRIQLTLDDANNFYISSDYNGTLNLGSTSLVATTVGGNAFVAKLDASLNFIWAKQFRVRTSVLKHATDVSGNVYFIGEFNGTADFDPGLEVFNLISKGDDDVFVVKLDNLGNFVWAKNVGGAGGDNSGDISVDKNAEDVYLVGSFNGTADFDPGVEPYDLISAGATDMFIAKLDQDGDFVWAKSYGSTSLDSFGPCALDTSGNFYSLGLIENKGFLVKLDDAGNTLFNLNTDGYRNAMTIDLPGNIYIAGSFEGTVDFDPGSATYNLTSTPALYDDVFIQKIKECFFPSAPTDITPISDLKICSGFRTTLKVSPRSGVNTQWFSTATGGTAVASGDNFYIQNLPLTTTYYAESNNNGCASSRTEVKVLVDTSGYISSIITPASVCDSGAFTLKVAGRGVFNWYTSSTGNEIIATGSNFTTPMIYAATTYYVEAQGSTCTSIRKSVNATVFKTPKVLNTVPGSRCGIGNVNLGATASAGGLAWFSTPSGGTYFNTGNVITIYGLSQTTHYYVQGQNNGCISPRVEVIATINNIPSIVSTKPGVKCGSGVVELEATASQGALSWFSSATSGTTIGTGSPFQTENISANTVYYVSATNNNCTSSRQAVAATINSIPQTPIIITPINYCEGISSVALEATGTNLLWYNSENDEIGSAITPVPSTVTSGTSYYYVSQTSNNCESNKAAIEVNVNSLPTISINTSLNDDNICIGEKVSLSASGASTYSWTEGIDNEIAFIPQETKEYLVTGTDDNGCVNSESKIITVNPLPVISITSIPENAAVCLGEKVILSASGASTYSWTEGIDNEIEFIPQETKEYVVTGTDDNGCVNSVSQIITVSPLPVINITSIPENAAICLGEKAILTASGASAYSWTEGIGNEVEFIPQETKEYVVTGTDDNGCVNSASQIITVNLLPVISITSIPENAAICLGEEVSLTADGANYYSWSSNTNVEGSNQSTITVVPEEIVTYKVTGIDNNSCSNSVEITLSLKENCNITSVKDALYQEVRIFPNPISEFVTFETNNSLIESVEIVDMNGVVVFYKIINSQQATFAPELPQGVYTIKLYSTKGVMINKLIKN